MGQKSSIQLRMRQYDEGCFKYPMLLSILQNKGQINFDQVKDKCIKIGEGYCAQIYLYKQQNLVFKINKGKPSVDSVCKEIVCMEKVNSIWPDLFKYLVFNNHRMVGFAMKYFDGKKIWQAYTEKGNIYCQNPQSRVRLVKKLKQIVRKIQEVKICHGDMHIDNIMIKQLDKTKQDCQILIIDYGLAFQISDYAPQKISLTGWHFLTPPQSKKKLQYYHADGINAYMFGWVALQILLKQTYDDYSHYRSQTPEKQLVQLQQQGFDQSIRNQVLMYLSEDVNLRNKMLFSPSIMKEEVRKVAKIDKTSQKNSNLKYTFDENYYTLHPQKLGYKV